MTVDDCYQLGYVVKTHGLKGEVQIFLDVDSPNEYQNLESVFVRKGQQLIPFFIESISFNGSKAIVAFEDILDLESAQTLKGSELYLPLETLPKLDGNQFYIHEIQGFDLMDVNSDQKIGRIAHVIESGSQLLFSVLTDDNVEVLIPYDKELLVNLDRENHFMSMSIPEGLVDIYINPDEN